VDQTTIDITNILAALADYQVTANDAVDGLSISVPALHVRAVCHCLRDQFALDTLIDVCGVDYLTYGQTQWPTEQASTTGFSRGVGPSVSHYKSAWPSRFAVVYHLLSVQLNYRLRLKAWVDSEHPRIDSVVSMWASANWFEREIFDLYGIIFEGHPDLRRLLTDYGFIGHPFRKDFPISGTVEARYDAEAQRVIYDPVSIEPRVLVPKVCRHQPHDGESTHG